jgi:hypothetical protein
MDKGGRGTAMLKQLFEPKHSCKWLIFLDESADASFRDKSVRYFSITCLTIPVCERGKINKTIRRYKKELYELGWSSKDEIKASALHSRYKTFPLGIDGDQVIKNILQSLKTSCQLRIDYLAVSKSGLTNPPFKKAFWYYDFFASELLKRLVSYYRNCYLTVDEKDETKVAKKVFNGYIMTRMLEKYIKKNTKGINLTINHAKSHLSPGVQAVDFFSWAVYQKIARNDNQFFEIFSDVVHTRNELFFDSWSLYKRLLSVLLGRFTHFRSNMAACH